MPIIGAAAKFEDEINAQMDTEVPAAAAVNTVGAATRNARNNNNGKPKVGAAAGVATCKICSKPGHNALGFGVLGDSKTPSTGAEAHSVLHLHGGKQYVSKQCGLWPRHC